MYPLGVKLTCPTLIDLTTIYECKQTVTSWRHVSVTPGMPLNDYDDITYIFYKNYAFCGVGMVVLNTLENVLMLKNHL